VGLLALALSACQSNSDATAQPLPAEPDEQEPTGPVQLDPRTPIVADQAFLLSSTVSQRVSLPLPQSNQMLSAGRLAQQLAGRCSGPGQ
jgi:hypothetical protein